MDSNSNSVSQLRLESGDALVIVDVQNDFLPGGAMPVAGGDTVVPVCNRYLAVFAKRGLPVFVTRDWHPPNHCSFREQGGTWPAHCVAGTWGAEFSAALQLPPHYHVISKANEPDREAYSDFDQSDFNRRLRDLAVRRLFIGGLATDYCVRATTLDALKRHYQAVLLLDAIRAIDVTPGDGQRAIEEMVQHGAVTARWEDIL